MAGTGVPSASSTASAFLAKFRYEKFDVIGGCLIINKPSDSTQHPCVTIGLNCLRRRSVVGPEETSDVVLKALGAHEGGGGARV